MPAPLFALVDCNSFYASCEKLMDPTLRDTPVVVLSNNDGNVVARSPEAKALGVPMGIPWFQLKDLAQREHIRAFSSNYALYADLSNRVVEILQGFTPHLEVYSIDEAFLDLAGFNWLEREALHAYGLRIRERIARWLGLAVCVGIASTKTLAKLANHCGKKALVDGSGVCDFTAMAPTALERLLARIPVGEVWGVGARLSAQLQEAGIVTVLDLKCAEASWIRSRFSVVLERTVQELRGVPCLSLEEMAPAKQQIMCSRSFGQPVWAEAALREALTTFVSRAAEKLRSQASEAGAIHVFIRTNPFKPDAPQYQRAVTQPLPVPTSDTRRLAQAAIRVLSRIYRPGFAYQKAGVMLTALAPRATRQDTLFDTGLNKTRDAELMATLDKINQKWGRGTVRLLAEEGPRNWQMKRGHVSPACTTDWDAVLTVRA